MGVASAVCCIAKGMKEHGAILSVCLAAAFGAFGAMDAAGNLPIFFSFFISVIGSIAAMKIMTDDVSSFVLFFALGAFTVFFDFLDNPLLTLCIPMIVYSLRLYEKGILSFSLVVLSLIGWIVGYGSIWAMKWILASLVLGEDVISNAMYTASVRAGVADVGETITPVTAIEKNFESIGLLGNFILVLSLASLLMVLVHAINALRFSSFTSDDRFSAYKKLVCVSVVLLIIAALPYCWYGVFSNHSSIHAEFIAWRNQLITLAALLCVVGCNLKFALANSRLKYHKNSDCRS